MAPSSAPRPPLEGLKILDLSRLLPGPYASLVLADLGATVVKVEDPQGGDYLRHMPPHLGDEGAMFLALNRDKKSIVLDLKSPQGAAALRRLARVFDVLIEGFRPGVMERLGLSYEALRAENPGLVYCSLSGYGQTGPDRLRAGHDLNYVARAGVLGLSGESGETPAMPGAQLGDVGGALFALVGLLAAVIGQRGGGGGRGVDISMTESAMAFLHMPLAARLLLGSQGAPLRRGLEPLNGGYPHYRVYRTLDGRFLSVGSLEPKFLSGLLAKLGRPELAALAYDAVGALAVRRELEARFAAHTRDYWVELFRGEDLCVEPVLEGDELVADAQHQARGVFPRGPDGRVGLRTPVAVGELPLAPAPRLGAHTREVLTAAGFSEDEMQRLGVSGR